MYYNWGKVMLFTKEKEGGGKTLPVTGGGGP
jgi:hypothetical protein